MCINGNNLIPVGLVLDKSGLPSLRLTIMRISCPRIPSIDIFKNLDVPVWNFTTIVLAFKGYIYNMLQKLTHLQLVPVSMVTLLPTESTERLYSRLTVYDAAINL